MSDSTLDIAIQPADDPIAPVQARLYRATAICRCLADGAAAVSSFESDLQAALHGVADILERLFVDLDPETFRAAVLASEGSLAEVSHGQA